MPGEQYASLNPDLTRLSDTLVSYRVEHQAHFTHGYVEVLKYHWSRQVEDVITVEDNVIALNMALTPRPAHTRIARLGREIPAKPEDIGRLLVLMPGSSFHLSAPTGGVRSLHCALSVSKFEEILGDRLDWSAQGGAMELTGSAAEIEWLLNRIYQELRRKQIGWETAIEAYANALCVELARRLRRGRPEKPELHKGGLAPWRMQLLRERVHADAPAPRLAELAELCGTTVRQLSRAFKAETGKTLGRFVEEATIDRAHRLLISSDRPIGDIAADLGFASAAGFAHAFRRSTGILPSQVRQR